jgi:hypothetical protein
MTRPEPPFHRVSSERQDGQLRLGNECVASALWGGGQGTQQNWQVLLEKVGDGGHRMNIDLAQQDCIKKV